MTTPARKKPAAPTQRNADLSELMTTISNQLAEIIGRLESFGFAKPRNPAVSAKRRTWHKPGRPKTPLDEAKRRYRILRFYRRDRAGGVAKKVFCENLDITELYLNAILQMQRRHAKAERP